MKKNLYTILLTIVVNFCLLSQTTTGIYPHIPGNSVSFTGKSEYKAFEYVKNINNAVSRLPFRILEPKTVVPGRTYPVIYMLHGRGEAQPFNNDKQLTWGAQMHLAARNRTVNPVEAYVVFPQEPFGQWTNSPNFNFPAPGQVTTHLRMVWDLVDSLLIRYPMDHNRIYIHGLSSGGTGVWASIYHRPDLFAAAQPMSAPGDTSQARKIASMPLWLHQGGLDTNPIPYISQLMIEALKKAGAVDTSHLRYSEYPTVAHFAWEPAYANPDFIPFFLRHSKRKLRVLNGLNPYCPGEQVTLAFSYGMDAYQWYKDGVALSGQNAPNLPNIAQNGNYYVTFKRKGNNTWENSDTLYISQNTAAPKPLVTPSGSTILPSPDANRVILRAPKNYQSYEWSNGATSDSIIVTTNGTFTLKVRESAVTCWSATSDPIFVKTGGNASGSPSAPTNLVAAPRSSSSILLNWVDQSTTETGFEIYRALNAGGPYAFTKLLGSNVTQYIDTLLLPNTRYYYKVRAINTNGGNLSTLSTYANTFGDFVTPSAPSGLIIASVDEIGGLTLSWVASTDDIAIKEYRIYNNNTQIGVSATNTAYLTLDQTIPVVYNFNVVAVDYGNNTSVPSNIVNFAYNGRGLVAKYYPGSWVNVPDFNNLIPTRTGLVATPKMGGSNRYPNLLNGNVDLVPPSQTDFFGMNLKGYIRLAANTTYTFYLSSDDGSLLWINNQLLINHDGLHGSTVKQANYFSATATWVPVEISYFERDGGQALDLRWQAVKTPSNGSGEAFGQADIPADRLSYFKTGTVIATSANPGQPSTPTVANLPNPVPANPTTVDKPRLRVTWVNTNNNLNGVVSFEIYRRISLTSSQFGSYTPWEKIAQIPRAAGNTFEYIDSVGLIVSDKYHMYAIKSVSATGVSVQSGESNRILLSSNFNNIGLVSTPTGLAATALSNSVIGLTWNDVNSNESGTEIWRSSFAAGPFSLLAKTGINRNNFNDSTCNRLTVYYYKVRAFNYKGFSAFSTVVSDTTLNTPNIPSGLTAKAFGPNDITLSWLVTDDAAYGYKIFRSTALAGTYVMIDSVANPLLSTYKDKNLTASTTYYYKIKAFNTEESNFTNPVSATTTLGVQPTTSNWRLPIVSNTFTSSFYPIYSNTNNANKLKVALENGSDLLDNISLNSTTPATNDLSFFTFRLPAASEFLNGAMMTYNIVVSNDSAKLNTNDCLTYWNGSANADISEVLVYTSTNGTTWTLQPKPWKSCRNADLQKIDIPVAWANLYVKIEFKILGLSSGRRSWLTEVGLYKFLGNDVRHNYFVLTGASFEEPNFPMGLRAFRKMIATHPDLANQGKDLLIFNMAWSGSNSLQLTDSMQNYLSRHPKAGYVIVHQGGNNINSITNNMRPLTFERLKTNPNASNFIRSFENIFTTIYDNGKIPYVSRMHFRDYKDGFCNSSPSTILKNDSPPVNAGRNQENGSLPLNLLIDSLTRTYAPFAYNEAERRSAINFYPVTLNYQILLGGFDGIHMQDQQRYADTLTNYWINYVIRHAYTGSFAAPKVYDPANQVGGWLSFYNCARPVPANKPNLEALTLAAVQKAKETKSGNDIWEARILVEQLGNRLVRVPLVQALDSLRDFRSPENPSDLSVNAIDNTSVQLNWLDLSAVETAYHIYRSDNGGASYILAGTVPANAITYTDNGLSASFEYKYYVRAVNGTFKSGLSNIVSIRPTVTYYLKTSGDATALSSWSKTLDGNGASPTDFTGAGQTYVVTNRTGVVSVDNSLSINGNYSKLVVPEGQSLKFNTGVSFAGNVEVHRNAKLYAFGNTLPNITTIDTTSFLILGNSYTLPSTFTWGHIEVVDNQTLTLSSDTVNVKGNLILTGASDIAGNNSVIKLKGDLVINDTNSVISNTALVMNGTVQKLDAKSGTIALRSLKIINNAQVSIINSSKLNITGVSGVSDRFVINTGSSFNIGTSTVFVNGNTSINSSNQLGYFISNGGSIYINTTSTDHSNLRFGSDAFQNFIRDLKVSVPADRRVELRSGANLKNNLELTSGTFKTNNLLTLLADFSNSSRILKVGEFAVLEDSITHQNYIGPFKKQSTYYIGTPIKNRTMNEWKQSFTIRSVVANNIEVSDLRSYSESLNNWVQLMDRDTNTVLTPGKGFNLYIPQARLDPVYGGATYYNIGHPVIGNGIGGNTSAYEIDIAKQSASTTGWNLVANPYPCELDWNQSSGFDKSAISNIVHFWDGMSRSYLTYDGNTQTSLNGASSIIPVGQGFFVQKHTVGAGKLRINENAKVGATPDHRFYRTAQPEVLSKLFIHLTDGVAYSDESALVFGEDFSAAYDVFDHKKLLGQVVNVYSRLAGNALVLQCLPKGYSSPVPLGITANGTGSYYLNFNEENLFAELSSLYLYDSFLNKTVNLLENRTYKFDITSNAASKGDSRFILNYTFKEQVITTVFDHMENQSVDVFPNPFTHELNIAIKSHKETKGMLTITNISGLEIYKGEVNVAAGDNLISADRLLDFEQHGKGVYILKIVTDNHSFSSKLIYK